MRLVLYRPEIPHNVGALLRLCACWNIPLDCIGPFPFLWSNAHLKRAGLDYIEKAQCHRYPSWQAYQDRPAVSGPDRCILLTTGAGTSYLDFSFQSTDRLMVGSESCGVPQDVSGAMQDGVKIPMSPTCRCLNMSMSAAIVLSEALRQTQGHPPF